MPFLLKELTLNASWFCRRGKYMDRILVRLIHTRGPFQEAHIEENVADQTNLLMAIAPSYGASKKPKFCSICYKKTLISRNNLAN